MTKEDILALIPPAQAGDGEAMNRLLTAIDNSVYFSCLKSLGDSELAHDSAQEILIRVFTKLPPSRNPPRFSAG